MNILRKPHWKTGVMFDDTLEYTRASTNFADCVESYQEAVLENRPAVVWAFHPHTSDGSAISIDVTDDADHVIRQWYESRGETPPEAFGGPSEAELAHLVAEDAAHEKAESASWRFL